MHILSHASSRFIERRSPAHSQSPGHKQVNSPTRGGRKGKADARTLNLFEKVGGTPPDAPEPENDLGTEVNC